MSKGDTTEQPRRQRRAAPRDPDRSRRRILDAAKIRFSHASFEGAGVRDIAADAGVDPALVIRHFGSKEALFRAIVDSAFGTDDLLADGVARLASHASELLLGDWEDGVWQHDYNPLLLMLASISSPLAGPILATGLDRDFLAALATALGGARSRERSMMIAAQILGLALIRIVASRDGAAPVDRQALAEMLEGTLDNLLRQS
ncbi:TetR/AcrR family transcriptional regulator [Sphingomonas sp.]|uniref:TetR/AcrR family transcriptional regulator n=1 Tax=Sphingomonas sp. TaxID=28214 RepID=UPI003D6D4E94